MYWKAEDYNAKEKTSYSFEFNPRVVIVSIRAAEDVRYLRRRYELGQLFETVHNLDLSKIKKYIRIMSTF